MVYPPHDDDDAENADQKRVHAVLRKAEDRLWRDAVDAEELRIWRVDVDHKLDKLCAFSETYSGYLSICLKREQEFALLRGRVTEKLLGSVILAGIAMLGIAMWQYIKEHIK